MIRFVFRQEGGRGVFAHFHNHCIIYSNLVVQFLFAGWFDSVEVNFNVNLFALAAGGKEF